MQVSKQAIAPFHLFQWISVGHKLNESFEQCSSMGTRSNKSNIDREGDVVLYRSKQEFSSAYRFWLVGLVVSIVFIWLFLPVTHCVLVQLSAPPDISFNWRSAPRYIQSCSFSLNWFQTTVVLLIRVLQRILDCKEQGAKSISGRQMRSGDLPICIIFPPKTSRAQICRPSPSDAPTYFGGGFVCLQIWKHSVAIAWKTNMDSRDSFDLSLRAPNSW